MTGSKRPKAEEVLPHLLRAAGDRRFLHVFQTFCEQHVPRNGNFRENLMQCIQNTSHSTALQEFQWYDSASILAPLLEPWQATLDVVLQRHIVTRVSLPLIDEKSLKLLTTGDMISDEIVDAYLRLIREKSGALVATTSLLECFRRGSTYNPINRDINVDTVKRVGQVLVPIYQEERKHWTFARLVYAAGVFGIEYFDSLFETQLPPRLQEWLIHTFPGVSWKTHLGRSPKQPPYSLECGPFMLMGIRLLSFGSQHLLQADAEVIMPTFRRRILAELLAQSLDPTSADHARYIAEEQAAERKAAKEAEKAGEAAQQKRIFPYRGTGSQPSEAIDLDPPESTQILNDVTSLESDAKGADEEGHTKEDAEGGGVNEVQNVELITSRNLRPRPHVGPPIHDKKQPMTADRKAKRRNLEFALMAARSFGDPEKMLEILRGAVGAYRADTILESGEESPLLRSWKHLGGDENAQTIFWNRLNRQRFSYHFYRERESVSLDLPKHQARVRFHMQKVLGCEGDKSTWKAAQHQAFRSSFWTELQELFGPSTGLKYAALCAAPGSTTSLEAMNRDERAVFIKELGRRFNEQDGTLRRNLQDASQLCWDLAEKKLPNEQKHATTLPIERHVDLEMMSFASAVSTSMRLRLPGVRTE
ncbi:hypothetical protein F5882DRAFT_517835 [Hyaloscypha sp. PMI_1271]|nr:hypothetical protein F5882DRAFT_517835 [Hyaloscypha sp. PMI_1271]